MKHFNYIISGSGAAGLSLLCRLITNNAFKDKSILVIDKENKTVNDRTWCFWEKQAGVFEPVVYHHWNRVNFYSKSFSGLVDLSPYTYKMIRSSDFYSHVLNRAKLHNNVSFIYGNIESLGNDDEKAFIIANGEKFTADYVFNSIILNKPVIPSGKHYLLQHFKGYTIQTKKNIFDPASATLMDFRISQQYGTAFMYVLPTSGNKALIEYTLFSKNLLSKELYDEGLKDYISNFLKIDHYDLVEEEFGIIPMTNIEFKKSENRIINIGTAGGQTKGSSGYTFQFIQKHSDQVIEALLKNESPVKNDSLLEKRFGWYDSVLLNVIGTGKYRADEIFAKMFQKNPVDRVLRFLDNESSVEDDLRLLITLPFKPFIKAAFEEI